MPRTRSSRAPAAGHAACGDLPSGERCAERARARPGRSAGAADGPEEQLSLFAAVSAVAGDAEVVSSRVAVGLVDEHDWSARGDDDLMEIRLEPPPLPNGRQPDPIDPDTGARLTRVQLRRRLRDRNAAAVKELVRSTPLDHRQVNAELNRLAGVRGVTEATVEELQRRLDHANRWLSKV